MAEVPVKQYFRQAAVPVYEGSVAQRPILQQALTVKATENDFGAQVGKGMQSLGEGLGKMAEVASKLRDLQADTTAKDSKTAFERAKLALEHGDNGYLNTSGQSAVEGYPGYEEALAKLQKTFEPKDPLAAGKYEAMVAPVVTTGLEAAIKHKAQGQKEWVGKAAEGRLSLAKDQAIVGYNKPEQVSSSVASGVAEIYNLGKLNGWTPEVTAAKAMEFTTGLHTGVAMTMVGKPGGATAAMDYLKANNAQVDPKIRAEVEKKIRPFAIDEKGKQIATEIVSEKRTPAGAADEVVTGAVDKAPSGKADTGSGKDVGTRGGGNAGKDTVVRTDKSVGNSADGGDAKAQSGQLSADGVNGATAEELQRGGPTRAKAFLTSISGKPNRPGDALPLDNDFAENAKAFVEDAPEAIRKGLGVSFVDPKSRASVASASSVSSGRSIQLTYEGRPLDQAPAQVLDWLHDNAEKYGLRFPYETAPSSTAPEAFGRGGSTLVAAQDGVAARSHMLSEADAVKRINQIADEKVRASTKRHFSNAVNVISNAEIEKSRSAKIEVFQAVMNGRPVSDVPLDVQIAAGPDTVNVARELEAKGSEVKSNLDLYYELSMKSAIEPHQFLKMDLAAPEIINNLSREHWKNLHDKQMSVLNREITDERDGTFYKQAFSEASLTLKAAGIRDASKIVRFNARFQHEIDQWVKRKGEYPTFAERQTMINILTMEVTYVEKRSSRSPMQLIDDDEDQVGRGFMFDNDVRPEGSEVRVVPKYERIGIEDRKRIYKDLMREYGRAPLPAEIDKRYRDEAMDKIGTD